MQRTSSLAVIAGAGICLAAPVQAQPVYDKTGTEFHVNTYTSGAQGAPAVAMADDGSFTMVWQSDGQDGSYAGSYGQRFSYAGAIAGSEFQVNTFTLGDQASPAIAYAADGSFAVVWNSMSQDGDNHSVICQRYSSTGTAVGSEFQVNTYTTSEQRLPAIAMADDGSFAVVWQSFGQDGNGFGIYGQRYSSTGAKTGSEFQINTYTASDQTQPDIAMAADGSFAVVWQSNSQDGSSGGIYGQRYSSTGAKTGSEFRVNTYTSMTQTLPAIAIAGDGSFTVVWISDGQDGSSYGIYGQRYSSTGSAAGPEFRINTYVSGDQMYPAIAMAGDGSFTVVWISDGQDGSSYGVYGQCFSSAGTTVGTEFQVNSYTNGNQSMPSVARVDTTGFVVAWQSFQQEDGATDGIYGQRYAAVSAATIGQDRAVLPVRYRLSARNGRIEVRVVSAQSLTKAILTAAVYDCMGRQIEMKQARSGTDLVLISGPGRLAPGLYFVDIQAGSTVDNATKKWTHYHGTITIPE